MAGIQEEFGDLMQEVFKEGASDLHLTVGRRPSLRVDGSLVELAKFSVTTPERVESFIGQILSEDHMRRFREEKEIDLSYSFKDKGRFRVNAFFQRGFMGAALRLIPTKIRTVEELNLPSVLLDFAQKQQGFFLVVGPTGHGKTTTLAALIDFVNHSRTDHIITIEDPIEYLFTSDRAIVDQREVGIDTKDFHQGLRSMFREDVDVAMIGEMRDAETMATAVTAAETGHLVFSTLHTNNAAQTIDRIIDTFPPDQQGQIRAQLSATLIGIISQRLIPRTSGGLIPAVEIMIANPAIRNLIREDKTHEIDIVIETSSEEGMVSLNRSLVELVRKGEVPVETALNYALNPQEFSLLMKR